MPYYDKNGNYRYDDAIIQNELNQHKKFSNVLVRIKNGVGCLTAIIIILLLGAIPLLICGSALYGAGRVVGSGVRDSQKGY